ncbi:hypothetical protein L323_12605 [Ruminiclostridium papyrosolvens C7]|uniref:Uncharacterized protein n=2 Tax=Ruminiclostridium papyrosolvens TaxID=29362 RepID=U4R036_9FIRM|nr:hypothetical protein L323_12605 [Ruminiclostridium papyrosolvens C7]
MLMEIKKVLLPAYSEVPYCDFNIGLKGVKIMSKPNTVTGDAFVAQAVNQKNLSLNANVTLNAYICVEQEVREFQLAVAEAEEEDC